MAAVIEFPNTPAPSSAAAAEAFEIVAAHLESLDPRAGMRRINSYRNRLDALEAGLLAAVVKRNGGDTKAAETVAKGGSKRSRRASRSAAKRGAAVAKNPKLGDKLAEGDLSAGQVDELGRAADKLGFEVLTDSELLDRLSEASDDETKAIVDDHIADNLAADQVETEYDRQHRARRVTKFRTNGDDLSALMLAGDDARIAEIWENIRSREKSLYRDDGGRDLALRDHPRTRDQRLFDAAYSYFTQALGQPAARPQGTSGASGGASTEPGDCVETDSSGQSRRYTPRRPKVSNISSRPSVVITIPAGKVSNSGGCEGPLAEMVGHGPIADSVAAHYLARVADGSADLLAMLVGDHGQPLWLSRSVRYATAAQYVALAIRDRGCGLCGADPSRCSVHHIRPWNSPAQGQTNIDELVLLCDHCHTHVHSHQLTVTKRTQHPSSWCDTRPGRTRSRGSRSGEGQSGEKQSSKTAWTTRPATASEIAPPRPGRGKNPQRE